MLQEFLRCGKKWADKPDSNLRRVPVLNLEFAHGQSGFQPTVENLPDGRHRSGGFFGGFLRWIFGRKMQKKNPPKESAGKSASRKRKIRRCMAPPKICQPGPKIRRKTYKQIRLSNLQVHARFFSIENACSWKRLQSMDSGTLFVCLLGMVEAPMLKYTCSPSAAAAVRRDKVCCAPFQTTVLVTRVHFGETPRDSAHSWQPN